MKEIDNPFTPLTANYHWKEHTLSFKNIVDMDNVIKEADTKSLEYESTEKYLNDLNISHKQLSMMADRCQDVERAALTALISLDMSALGAYAETAGDAFMWTLHHGNNWSIEESDAGKVAFVLYKIHHKKAKDFIWSDVEIPDEELKKYSEIL